MADPAELTHRAEAGARQADEYASKNWSGDDYTAAFDSYIAGYQAARAALTPQPSAEDVAVLDALIVSVAEAIKAGIEARSDFIGLLAKQHENRAAVLARMAGKVPPSDDAEVWPCPTCGQLMDRSMLKTGEASQ